MLNAVNGITTTNAKKKKLYSKTSRNISREHDIISTGIKTPEVMQPENEISGRPRKRSMRGIRDDKSSDALTAAKPVRIKRDKYRTTANE